MNEYFKISVLNILKELKETMNKEVKEIRMIHVQVENIWRDKNYKRN